MAPQMRVDKKWLNLTIETFDANENFEKNIENL
jgi:hypothetical protein